MFYDLTMLGYRAALLLPLLVGMSVRRVLMNMYVVVCVYLFIYLYPAPHLPLSPPSV